MPLHCNKRERKEVDYILYIGILVCSSLYITIVYMSVNHDLLHQHIIIKMQCCPTENITLEIILKICC